MLITTDDMPSDSTGIVRLVEITHFTNFAHEPNELSFSRHEDMTMAKKSQL